MIVVDGTSYAELAVSVARNADVKESDNSGLMLDRSYFSDKIGTYLTYDVQVAVPVSKEALYTVLYEAITDPVGSHTFTLPYNQGLVNVTGRIESVEDRFYRSEGSTKIWRKIEFSIRSNYPTKSYTLGEIVELGMQTQPDPVSPAEGDVYQYTSGTWVQLSYSDADEVYY